MDLQWLKAYLRELAIALFHCRRQNRRLFCSRLGGSGHLSCNRRLQHIAHWPD